MTTWRTVSRSLLALSFVAGCAAPATDDSSSSQDDLSMGTKAWDATAEKEWSTFIAGIGNAREANKCTTLAQCINDPTINPYKAPTDTDLNVFADCSKVGIGLRGYFAIKTGRPFKYVSEVLGDRPASLAADKEPDYRYTANNHPTAWSTAKTSPTMQALFNRIASLYHSGFYRMGPTVENDDTYPIDIRPGTVRPGTVYYDPNGHVLLVYKVDTNGTVHFIDGHPDNSLSYRILTTDLALGGVSQGGGFRNFRPVDSHTLDYAPNSSLTDLGSGQYGHGAGYVEWVRLQLSGGQALPPETQLGQLVDQLCTDISTRVAAVDAGKQMAAADLVDLPPNIYGADGDWESFSTPGRDQKLRSSFRGIVQFMNSTAGAHTATSRALVAKYASIWKSHLTSCKITYANSAGDPVNLTLADIQARLFDLSFDPYQCVEMRWGAYPKNAQEYASCSTRDAAHEQRFTDEQSLRNIIDRPAAGTPTPIGFGPATHEDVDVSALLTRLAH
ncbi:MAG: hypothetical protein QOI41_1730 [Myxococcales bacterium]|nr:hypothetical protein [Myxococcales bacterium]